VIKEAINRILELQRPEVFTDANEMQRYTGTNKLVGLPTQAHAPVVCSSLESLCKFALETKPEPFFEITGPASVSLIEINTYDGQEEKESICSCKAILPENFPFGQFLEPDKFTIKACDFFERNDNFKSMIATVSSITDFNQTDVEDDGLSQTATTKTGVGRKDRKTIDPFIALRSYRTFREIEQPEVSYLLRIQKGQQGSAPLVALFEASGYHWKIQAIDGIAKYIAEKIPTALVMK